MTKEKKTTSSLKQAKVETLSIRLSPKLKYGLELLARKQYRSLSSVAEWALDMALTSEDGLMVLDSFTGFKENLLEKIWDPLEPDRFVKLAFHAPNLMTYEEEILWKLIKENGALWKGKWNNSNEWAWECHYSNLAIEVMRKHWKTFNDVADGKADSNSLPTWRKTKYDSVPVPF